ncbi:MAG: acetyl-CoA carboxylase biotin carboxyl carrier protein subunit [Lachnospiraceae bacterium]|nr:acetyl-CoA carboxylase biotin carboxyl carrier protein subunit [Lachnospiraceae bacterium]
MDIRARMAGQIIAVHVKEGDRISGKDVIAVLDAMKMEQPVSAPADGTVVSVNVAPGDIVKAKQLIAVIES